MATRSLVTRAATSALRPRTAAGMPPAARHQLLHAIPTQVSGTPPMAAAAASALIRCRFGAAPGTPATAVAPSRFFATTPARNQNGIAIRRFSYDGKSIVDLLKRAQEEIIRRAIERASRGINEAKSTRELLERVKEEEKITRRVIKWTSRGLKAVKWSCYFCVSVTAAAAVMDMFM